VHQDKAGLKDSMGSPRERGGILTSVSGQVRARAGKEEKRGTSGGSAGQGFEQVGLP
jgi:hypothetical protein